MELRGMAWGFSVALALVCGVRWPPAHSSALAPENEVPLRPTVGLEEGRVTTVALPKGRTRRLYFTLKKKAVMMAVTVSPCDAPLEWSLTSRTIKDRPLKSLPWSSKKSVPEVWWRGPGSEDKIYSYTGNAMDNYTGPPHAAASIYVLRLRSKEEDTRAEVYLYVGPGTSGAFPQLPADPRVHILGVGMTSVTLSWEPSPSLARKGYDYCVLVNPHHNYPSMCAAREGPRKDREADKPPRRGGGARKDVQGKGTGLWPLTKDLWRAPQQQQQSQRKGSYRRETRPEPPPALRDADAAPPCVCRGAENVCTVSELLPEVQYYFDVFAVDAANGTSAAYTGTFARTHEEARPAVAPLREGELRWVTFRGDAPGAATRAEQLFSFRPRGWQQNGLLTLQSCGSGGGSSKGQRVKVTVSTKGRVLSSQALGEELVQVWLHGSSSYLVHLERDAAAAGGEGLRLKMQTSSAYHRMGAPSLPSTLQIKSFKRLRGCRSVTLAWMGTEERSLYCVYRRMLPPEGPGDGTAPTAAATTATAPCLGPESRPDTEQVLCKYFQELNPRRAVTTAVIGGLEPGRAYVFDVYLMRRWGIAVKYVSKTIRTRREC